MVLPIATSILMVGFLYTMDMAYGYFVESRSKRQFTELFGQYVPPELVDRMASDPEKYTMEPKEAELTILFSDVRGFTGISEMLKPEELREYMNEYLTEMSGIIRSKYHGTLDKYIGDAIMAFWGAPVDDAQHARNAVLAALAMQTTCDALNEKFGARGWPKLKIGIGINYRDGSRRRHGLAGAPRLYRDGRRGERGFPAGRPDQALPGRHTGGRIDPQCRQGRGLQGNRPHQGEGPGRAVSTVYEPLALEANADEPLREELRLWNQALRDYRAQQWDKADVSLLNLQRRHPGRELYELYAQRVAGFRRTPPPDGWDGVTVFDEK